MDFSQGYTVHKFGGSSVGTPERILSLKSLLTGKNELIVVSAFKGVTSELQSLLDLSANNSPYTALLAALKKRHECVSQAILSPTQIKLMGAQLDVDFAAIEDILKAVTLLKSYSQETESLILGLGEQWSAKIISFFLGAEYLDATTIVYVSFEGTRLSVEWDKTQQAFNHYLKENPIKQLVITGFIASTLDHKRTTLGRNGSDFSSAIFAHLIKAKRLFIWTDVDGIYTADPNRVPAAFVIDSLSYQEALELAYFGAKVLHPATIAPLLTNKIPLYIKNSFNPDAPGTYIGIEKKCAFFPVKGLSCIDDIALINIEGTGMIGVSGITVRVFGILNRAHISVILISQASSEHSICFAVSKKDAHFVEKELRNHLQHEIEKNTIQEIIMNTECGILAAVGDGMIGAIGVLGQLCLTLAKANVNISAIAQGSSERNISVVIHKKDLTRAVQAVHAGFYLSPKTISIGLIGVGVVGSTFLKQLKNICEDAANKYQTTICIRGIMNSRKMIFNPPHKFSIDLSDWQTTLSNSENGADLDQFINHIHSIDIPHTAIIDCTPDKKIARSYLHFMERGIHVITPNKQANSGDIIYYHALKAMALKKKCHYLYEATVCAGLPIITTLHDLIHTGDKIIAIKGIVSGTLSFIFDEIGKGQTFSESVFKAKSLGYTEPDPRDDLSGLDVARKWVCLSRELGNDTLLEEVDILNLIPEKLKQCSLSDFLTHLPLYDNEFQTQIEAARLRQERLSYVGTLLPSGKIKIALESHPLDHPFSALQGSDNIIIFHTARYNKQPLIIQGPGAGAEVTAAGIFADLLRLVSYL